MNFIYTTFHRYIWSQPKQFLFFPIIKLFFVIVYLPDPSIPIVIKLGILPYGLSWSVVNWIVYLNYNFWTVYLFIIDIFIIIILYRKIHVTSCFLIQLYNIWLFVED